MSNFERIKACKDELEMCDLIGGYVCNNLHKLIKNKVEFDSLELLNWLRSNKNIFGEERTTN